MRGRLSDGGAVPAMKVVHITPGSGNTFYCENCLRDVGLVKALRRRGHDVIMVPMYLPLFADDPDVTQGSPVFFGGINVYLQQTVGLFRHTPRWVDRVFDAPWLLKLAAAKAGSTRADGLGSMTLSMLDGETGRQSKELDRLVAWLSGQERPDIVHLSNALLVGLARRLKHELGTPIVCSLQDEDVWLDSMDSPYDRRCWDAIAERSADIDRYVAVSRYYADTMRERLKVPPSKLSVVYVGIEVADAAARRGTDETPTIGYLSRMAASRGLSTLADAFLVLRQDPALAGLRLKVTGGMTPDDKPFLDRLKRRLASAGAGRDVTFVTGFDLARRREVLESTDVFCVPVSHGEAFGTYVIEALASGVPAVEPALGAFPELAELSGGVTLYDPADPDALVTSLAALLKDPARAQEMGRRGRAAVEEHFTLDSMARGMIEVYEEVSG